MSEQAVVEDVGTVTGLQSADDRAGALTDEAEVIDFEPLFDGEDVTEAELKGEEVEDKSLQGKEAAHPEPKDDEPKKEDSEKKAETEKEAAEKAAEAEKVKEVAAKESEPDYTQPPPKGYVPLPALQEERKATVDLRKALSDAESGKQELTAEIEALKTAPADEPDWVKDFEVLASDKFDELVDDDPDKAIKYQHRLNEYNKISAAQNESKLAEKRRVDRTNQVITDSIAEIKTAIPDLYAEDNTETMEAFVKTAVDAGFDEQYLHVLSRPDTLIIPPGGKVPIPLGKGAVSLTKLIDTLRKSSGVRSELEKVLRPELEKEITAKLMKKMKDSPAGEFRSITSVPGSGEEPGDFSKVLSEAEIGNLSDADQEKYLSGAL